MSVLYIVVPGAVVVVAIAIAAYIWAARRGQFDDLVTPAWRVLHDDAEGAPRDEAATPHDEGRALDAEPAPPPDENPGSGR